MRVQILLPQLSEKLLIREVKGFFYLKYQYVEEIMNFGIADLNDVKELTELRLAYLGEDSGAMEKETQIVIQNSLPGYFGRHLNHDLIVYVSRVEKVIAACAFLLIVEKPMSPTFPTGKTGMVLNVYTRPEYRHRGYARKLMEILVDDAVKRELSIVELKATDAGYQLYKKVGFDDAVSKYHQMKWINTL